MDNYNLLKMLRVYYIICTCIILVKCWHIYINIIQHVLIVKFYQDRNVSITFEDKIGSQSDSKSDNNLGSNRDHNQYDLLEFSDETSNNNDDGSDIEILDDPSNIKKTEITNINKSRSGLTVSLQSMSMKLREKCIQNHKKMIKNDANILDYKISYVNILCMQY